MSLRDAIVEAAVAEIGAGNREKLLRYWESAMGQEVSYDSVHRLAWCGIFALYCLHAAGVAKDVFWKVGKGFLLQPPHPLKTTRTPQPGDIGYQNLPFQHHFLVENVNGVLIHTIDGNQPDIRRRTRSFGSELVFYSIEPLLALAAGLPSPSATPPPEPAEKTLQRAVNKVILAHPTGAPKLLVVDGIIGPLSKSAIAWARAHYPGELS
jgi:hypothetical protein